MELMNWHIFRLIRPNVELEDIRIAQVFKGGSSAIFIDKNEDVWHAAKSPECTVILTLIVGFSGRNIDSVVVEDNERPLLLNKRKGLIFELKFAPEDGGGISISCIMDMKCCISSAFIMENGTVIVLTDQGKVYENNRMNAILSRVIWMDNLDGEKCYCLQKDGRVYLWRENQIPKPLTHCPERVLKVCLGEEHGILLTETGNVFCWGKNSEGQLGNGKIDYNESRDVREIDAPSKNNRVRYLDIATTSESCTSAALSVNNEVYIWGQCGIQRFLTPTLTRFCDLGLVFSLVDLPQKRSLTNICLEPRENEGQMDDDWVLENSKNCDVEIKSRDEILRAHKIILQMNSKYFTTLFEWKETQHSNPIDLSEHSFQACNLLLRYFYTKTLHIENANDEAYCEFLRLVHEIDHSVLVKRVSDILSKRITVDNACLIFNTAYCLTMENLIDYSRKFIVINLHNILRSDGYLQMQEKRDEFISMVMLQHE